MKKTIALLLVLCMMLAAFPVFGESTAETAPTEAELEELLSGLLGGSESGQSGEGNGGLGELLSGLMSGSEGGQSGEGKSGLGDLLSGLMSGSESGQSGEDKSGIGAMLSGLVEKLKQEGKETVSALSSKVKEKLAKELANPDSKLSVLISSLMEKWVKGSMSSDEAGMDLGSLLGGLLGGSEVPSAEGTSEEDDETIAETLERLNKQAEADTGDSVPGKKEATSVEEFYGLWKESKFTFMGEDFTMDEYNEGVFIGENTYYLTQDGKKSPDYTYPETAEVFIRDGVLKVNCDGHWTTYVMTQDGEIVSPGESLLFYYTRVEQ